MGPFNYDPFFSGFLCFRCAQLAAAGKEYKRCTHRKFARSWISTFSTAEIIYSQKLGYTFYFHQVVIFERSEMLLRSFVTALEFQKLLFTDYPQGCDEVQARQAYLNSLNERYDFERLISRTLTTENVTPNAQMRDVRKFHVNSFLGAFNLRLNQETETRFVTEYAQLVKEVSSGRVKNIEDYGNAVQVTKLLPKGHSSRGRLKTNVMVGILVHAYSKCYVNSVAHRLMANGAHILRINADSICASVHKDVTLASMGVPISPVHLGSFKHELKGELKSLAQLGPNFLSLLWTDEAGSEKQLLKTCGIQVRRENESSLSHDSFIAALEASVLEEDADSRKIKTQNVRKIKQPGSSKRVNIRSEHCIEMQSALKRRRLVDKNYPYFLYPHGYREDESADGGKFVNPYIPK